MKKRILLVEDNVYLREGYAALILMAFDVVILTDKSGNDAINRIKHDSKFDLIICDFIMPDGNGDVVLNYLKEKEIKIPTIIFSTLEMRLDVANFPFYLTLISKDRFPTLIEKIQLLLNLNNRALT